MKKNFIAAGLLLAFVSVSFASMAQTKTPRVRERQENQQKRIAGGVNSGELTARETVKLLRSNETSLPVRTVVVAACKTREHNNQIVEATRASFGKRDMVIRSALKWLGQTGCRDQSAGAERDISPLSNS